MMYLISMMCLKIKDIKWILLWHLQIISMVKKLQLWIWLELIRERSTTREWKTLPEVGDIISFSDNSNNRVLVRVTGVDSWDNIKGNTEKLTQWSKDEGWTMTYALKKAFFRNKDPKKVHQVKFEMYTDKVYTNFEEIDGIAKAYALEETKDFYMI